MLLKTFVTLFFLISFVTPAFPESDKLRGGKSVLEEFLSSEETMMKKIPYPKGEVQHRIHVPPKRKVQQPSKAKPNLPPEMTTYIWTYGCDRVNYNEYCEGWQSFWIPDETLEICRYHIEVVEWLHARYKVSSIMPGFIRVGILAAGGNYFNRSSGIINLNVTIDAVKIGSMKKFPKLCMERVGTNWTCNGTTCPPADPNLGLPPEHRIESGRAKCPKAICPEGY